MYIIGAFEESKMCMCVMIAVRAKSLLEQTALLLIAYSTIFHFSLLALPQRI